MQVAATREKPKSVHVATNCLWVSAGLTVIATILQLAGPAAPPDLAVAAVTGLITAGFLALVAAKLSAGRGWARWLFAAVYAFGSLVFVLSMLASPETFLSLPMPLQASGVAQLVLQTIALVLIFTSASRKWFKEIDAAASP